MKLSIVIFILIISFASVIGILQTITSRSLSVARYLKSVRNAVTENSPIKVEDMNMTFYFFHKESEFVPLKTEVTNDQVQATWLKDRPLLFITHGYMDKYPGKQWIESMKKMIFEQFNNQVNVIVVNWQKGAISMYPKAAASTRTAGQCLAEFLINLRKIHLFSFDQVHLIGHSLGAHLSGFAGKHLNSLNYRLGQITGLDPAGPLFSTRNCTYRLCAGDAKLVIVLHTDIGSTGFGIAAKSGDVDVFLNGGKVQPGCHLSKITEQSPRKMLTCNHRRAHQFFIDSLATNRTDCELIAYQCDSFNDFTAGACSECDHPDQKCHSMDFKFDYQFKSIKQDYEKPYYLMTNSQAPYCSYVYQIQAFKGVNAIPGTIKLDMMMNEIKRVTFERPLQADQPYVSHLLKSDDYLGRIERIQLNNIAGNFVNKIQINYMSHSDKNVRSKFSSTLCPVDENSTQFVIGNC